MSKSIKEILPTILGQQSNWKIRILSNWETIWGNLSSKVHLERIDKHQLVIGVHDSCWLQELHMLSHLLLRTINKIVGTEQIKQLCFRKIEKKKTLCTSKKHTVQTRTPVRPIALSKKEQLALSLIKDPHLSNALKQFLVRCYQEK